MNRWREEPVIRAELVSNPYESPLGNEDEEGPTPEKFFWACLAILAGLTFWPVVVILISRWEDRRRCGKVEGMLVLGLSVLAMWVVAIAGSLWWGLLIWLFK